MTFSTTKRFLLAVAVLVVVAGLVIAIISDAQPISFGWVAYAPLSGDVFDPNNARLVSGSTATGLVIMTIGLLAVAFWAGLTVGARRQPRPEVAAAPSAPRP